MKKILLLNFLLLLPFLASAELLKDVAVLELIPKQRILEVKLQIKGGGTKSYFTIGLEDSDPKAFEKSLLILEKMKLKDKFTLNLDIPSFSASPSGSYYKSIGIQFSSSLAAQKKAHP